MTERKSVPLSPENKVRMEALATTARSSIMEMAKIVGSTLGSKPEPNSSTELSFRLKKPSADKRPPKAEEREEELHGIWEVCFEGGGCGCYDYDLGLCYSKPC